MNGRFGKGDGGLEGSWISRVWLEHFETLSILTNIILYSTTQNKIFF